MLTYLVPLDHQTMTTNPVPWHAGQGMTFGGNQQLLSEESGIVQVCTVFISNDES